MKNGARTLAARASRPIHTRLAGVPPLRPRALATTGVSTARPFSSSSTLLASSSTSSASAPRVLPRRTLATQAAVTETSGASPHPAVERTPLPVTAVPNSTATIAVLDETARLLAADVGGSAEWFDAVQGAIADLGHTRRARLAVYGESLAAPYDVVSALLQDPLTDSDAARQSLLERYYGTSKSTLDITYAPDVERTDGQLATPSSWLRTSGFDVLEVAPGEDAESIILTSDVVMLVLDPFRLATPLADVIATLAHMQLHVVVNGPLPPHVSAETLRGELDTQLQAAGATKYDVTFVHADAALRALDALSAALAPGGDRANFNAFQRDFVASNVGQLRQFKEPPQFQVATARRTAATALAYTDSVIASDRKVLSEAKRVVNDLRAEAAQGTSKARRMSVVARGINGGVVEGSVENSVATTQRALAAAFDGRLSWLSLVSRVRVDDVGPELATYLTRAFGDIEQQLVFEAGQLRELQVRLGDKCQATARQLTRAQSETAGHPFSSPLLLNHLASLALSIPAVKETSLTQPVTTRRNQLLNTALPRLQVTAQRSLLSTYSLALAGAAGSWMAYVPPLSLISGSTAFGLGALAVVSSLALGQAWWAKAQRRFWKDWSRVTNMLKDDLAANYDRTVESLVLAQPQTAADGLDDLVAKREKRLAELEAKVGGVKSKLGDE